MKAAKSSSKGQRSHRDNGKPFVVHADEKLTAFLELEAAISACGELSRQFRVILLKLQLVAKFGEKKVREALDPLITKCKLAMRGECDPSYSSSEMNGGLCVPLTAPESFNVIKSRRSMRWNIRRFANYWR